MIASLLRRPHMPLPRCHPGTRRSRLRLLRVLRVSTMRLQPGARRLTRCRLNRRCCRWLPRIWRLTFWRSKHRLARHLHSVQTCYVVWGGGSRRHHAHPSRRRHLRNTLLLQTTTTKTRTARCTFLPGDEGEDEPVSVSTTLLLSSLQTFLTLTSQNTSRLPIHHSRAIVPSTRRHQRGEQRLLHRPRHLPTRLPPLRLPGVLRSSPQLWRHLLRAPSTLQQRQQATATPHRRRCPSTSSAASPRA